jgi:hypothetical protein
MSRLTQKFRAVGFVANLCFFLTLIQRLPDGPQYLMGIGITFVLCAVTFGAAILFSGYRPQHREESAFQLGGGDEGAVSINESRSPVSTTS